MAERKPCVVIGYLVQYLFGSSQSPCQTALSLYNLENETTVIRLIYKNRLRPASMAPDDQPAFASSRAFAKDRP